MEAGLDWGLVLTHLERLSIAYALALPIGWERQKSERTVGLRTFPLVAVASCGFVLLAARALTGADALSRVLQGLVGGIGFIGGGAILRQTRSVHGTATAASIWNTGAIGAAVALGRYEIAIVLSVLNVATLLLLLPLKQATDRDRRDEKPH